MRYGIELSLPTGDREDEPAPPPPERERPKLRALARHRQKCGKCLGGRPCAGGERLERVAREVAAAWRSWREAQAGRRP